jgi:hypothetical protein
MPTRTHPLLLGLTLLMLSGCPKKTQDQPGLTGPPPSAPHHGAWFGSGLAFPGERLCLVFCPDGRLFAGDARCEDVFYEKFQSSWAYTYSGVAVHAESAASTIDFEWRQTGTHAVADIAGISNLPLDLQSRTSPLCGNAPMPEKPKKAEPAVPF